MLPEAAGQGQNFEACGHCFSLFNIYRLTIAMSNNWQNQTTLYLIYFNLFHAHITKVNMTMGSEREIQTMLRTNQNAGFIIMPSLKEE